jgi:histidine triad (HIT) family protein
MSDCIFCKIINKEIPATIIYEDDRFVAFKDINPIDKVHFLIIPKMHEENLLTAKNDLATREMFGEMLMLAPKLAKKEGLEGFRTMINSGVKGGQEVFHIHFHVYGGSDNLRKI